MSRLPAATAGCRWAARAGLLLLVGFWTWFIGANIASDGFATPPVVGLLLLFALGASAWCWPRPGGAVLAAAGVVALWFFANSAALWLIAVPCAAIAALAWCGAAAGPGQAADGGDPAA